MKTSRNDPCPCGSGKKYKQCCLIVAVNEAESPSELAWRRIRRANEGLVGKMLQFTLATYGEAAIDDAWDEFTLEKVDEAWQESAHGSAFLPWLLHHWSPDPDETSISDQSLYGVPPTRAYLERKAKQLDPTTQRYLQACLAAPFAFYEIADCEPGHGFRAIGLLACEEYAVLERSGSEVLQDGDILFASLVRCDGIVMMEGVAPAPMPPIHKLPILKLRKIIAAGREQFSGEQLEVWDVELRVLYIDVMESILNPPLPQLCNTDGDELSLQRLIFEIESAQEAFDALKHLALGATDEELLEGAERAADGSLLRVGFSWLKAGNKLHKTWDNTSLGMIEIDGSRLSVSVNSEKRAAKFKRIAATALRGRARYRVTEMQSVEQMLAQARTTGGGASPSEEEAELASRPEVRAQLAEMMSRHYDDWLRQKIPALRGKTPLQAVKDPDGREMVAALISQIERDGLTMIPPLDAAIPRRLREKLGLNPVT